MKKFNFILFPLFVFGFKIPSFSQEIKNDNSFEKIQKMGTLRVCSQAGFIPFEMKDNKGNWKGFDVEIMKMFTQKYSLKLKMMDMSLDGLIPALKTGKCDMIASGLTITEGRKKEVLFSKPVFTVIISAAFLDTPENRARYKKFSDIDSSDTSIASQTGTSATLFLSNALKNTRSSLFDTQVNMVDALRQKRAKVFVDDNVFIAQASKEMKIKFYTLDSNEKGELAMAARTKDTQLINMFNNFLESIQKNGEYEKIKKTYFK